MRSDLTSTLPGIVGSRHEAPIPSFFEFWPSALFYAPVLAQTAIFVLWYRSLTLPTVANPTITSGGLCGESKTEILDQVGGAERALIAPYVRLPPGPDLRTAQIAMEASGLAFPIVIKPDVGCNGAGVRRICDLDALAAVLRLFPADASVMLQEFVVAPNEAGIFYIRLPGEKTGRITSLTLKTPPIVVGDGRSTVGALVLGDRRASRVARIYLPRLGAAAERVPEQGEQVPLVFVGNHCRGSIFRDGSDHATPALSAAIECIARALPEFHFGRFDIRFNSLAELARGEGFRVLEVNGVGAEATHIWDSRSTLLGAWRAQLWHQSAAWRIGAVNRSRIAAMPTGAVGLWRLWRRQARLMAAYPESD